jgi:hypothetical protein
MGHRHEESETLELTWSQVDFKEGLNRGASGIHDFRTVIATRKIDERFDRDWIEAITAPGWIMS